MFPTVAEEAAVVSVWESGCGSGGSVYPTGTHHSDTRHPHSSTQHTSTRCALDLMLCVRLEAMHGAVQDVSRFDYVEVAPTDRGERAMGLASVPLQQYNI